jgi:predicted alpha/beta-fold hydrolase
MDPSQIQDIEFPPFSPPGWMSNAHLQTLVASRKPRRWDFGWQSWEPLEIDLGPDGKILAEASWQPGKLSKRPAVFLLHGMEGSAKSHYMIGMSRKAFAAGFHTVRVNTRNCGGTEHLTPTLYCAGLSQDVLSVVRALQYRYGLVELYGAGVSLGANILLKFLGEQGSAATSLLRGAAVISPPIDLAAGARKMEEPQNWIYQRYFVHQLIERMRRKTRLFPEIADMRRVSRVRTIREFDDLVTAPHFGYGTADNYYRLASSGPLLGNVRVPTLIIQAVDDPLIPFAPFQAPGVRENPALRLLASPRGGHTGFLGRRPACPADQDSYWAECRVVQFFSSLVNSQ